MPRSISIKLRPWLLLAAILKYCWMELPGISMSDAEMRAYINDLLPVVHTLDELRNIPHTPSADPDLDFYIPATIPEPMRASDFGPLIGNLCGSIEDDTEYERYENNGRNPVLP